MKERWFVFKFDKNDKTIYLTKNKTWSHNKEDAELMDESASDLASDYDAGCGSTQIEE